MSALMAASAPGALGYALYQSGPVDLTAVAPSAFIPIAPAVAGKTFITQRIFFFNTAASGTLSTPATIEIGQTGALGNIQAATSGSTNVTSFGFGVGGLLQANSTEATYIQGVASGVTVTIAATGTGGFAYTVNVLLAGFYL